MRVALDSVGVSWDPKEQEVLDDGVRRVRASLERFGVESDVLSVRVEELESRMIEARLELQVPSEVLPASVTRRALGDAVRGAFDLLLRRFERYCFTIDPGRYRPVGYDDTPDPTLRRYHEALLRHALPVMQRVAAHDIALLVDEGELRLGAVEPEDLVDTVIAAHLEESDGSASVADATWQLLDSLRLHIEAAVSEAADPDTDTVSLSQDVPADEVRRARHEPVDSEQVIWGSADSFDVSDVLADSRAIDPLSLADEMEQRDQLVAALFDLPEELRRRFTQVVVDQWSVPTVAAAWSRPKEEIQGDVALAARRLARELGPAWALTPKKVIEIYTAFGQVIHEERKADELAVAGGRE